MHFNREIINLAHKFLIEKDFQILSLGRLYSESTKTIPADYLSVEYPELIELGYLTDLILIKSDGLIFQINLLIDCSQHNSTRLSVDQLIEVGQKCLNYTGRVNGQKMPVGINIFFFDNQNENLSSLVKEFKKIPLKTKVALSSYGINTLNGFTATQVAFNGFLADGRFIKKWLKEKDHTIINDNNKRYINIQFTTKKATLFMLIFLLLIFVAQILSSTDWIKPEDSTLVDHFAAYYEGVFIDSEYYRLFTYSLLHGGYIHFILNMIALFVAGKMLESILGSGKTLLIFSFAAVGGALLSIMYNHDIFTIGASGGIMGLIAAVFTATLSMPFGANKTKYQMNSLYMLIPSLLPSVQHLSNQSIDIAAHLGGALIGAFTCSFMIRKIIKNKMETT